MLTEAKLECIENSIVTANSKPGVVYVNTSDFYALLAEVRELRLLLRDAVQDSTPGNRLWREGVKAGLKAASKAALKVVENEEWSEWFWPATIISEDIRRIDPDMVLPGI